MQPKKRTRTSHAKVRTGCHTCKARRVKCDEQQPACQKCITTGRTCEGYKVNHEWVVVVAPPRPPPTDGFEDDRSRLHFDYFRNQAVNRLSRFFDAKQWGKLVLQEAHSSPAVRHAVIALSCSHRHHVDAGSYGQYQAYTAQQYSKSIKLLIKETNDNTQESRIRTLMCGLLFISIETVRANFSAALHHLDGCLKIIKEVRSQVVFIPMFTLLDREACLLAGTVPQPPRGRKPLLLDPDQGLGTDDIIGLGFTSVLESLEYLFWLGNRVHGLMGWNTVHLSTADSFESYTERLALYEELLQWDRCTQSLVAVLPDVSDHDRLLLLRIHHRTLLTLLGSSFHGTETFLDTYHWAFQDIVNYITLLFKRCHDIPDDIPGDDCDSTTTTTTTSSRNGTLSASPTPSRSPHSPAPRLPTKPHRKGMTSYVLDCGTLFSLYWTALKCRDGRLRRHAIALLEATTLDGMALQAAVAKRIVEIEEGQEYEQEPVFGVLNKAEDIPEGMRVHNVDIDVNGDGAQAKVVIWRRKDGREDGEWCESVEWVPW
ncbi:unnamed protein product [Periconia digitata]|uniref:Zn(2)-C6 fungal-type domain-containing protein n=1 Tax=Periconia digitata TaxID=1303443 RepID=A0A9W4U3Q8_9PLEO|nr:unnamed protein product [Periconia digitata]